MKHFLFILLFCCSLPAFSKVDANSLLNINNRIAGQNSAKSIYTGAPIVKIENTVGALEKPKPLTPMEAQKYRLFGTLDIANQSLNTGPEPVIETTPSVATTPKTYNPTVEYNFTTPFGRPASSINIAHTSDFMAIIQIIDTKTILIEETIQQITTSPAPFIRDIALYPALNNNDKNHQITLLSATHNNQLMPYTMQQDDDYLTLTSHHFFNEGVNTYTLKYKVENALIPLENDTYQLALSLTGQKWSTPIDRFSLIILRGNKADLYTQKIVFGSNNADIKNAFENKTDSKSNSYYRLTHQLPAFADVKVLEVFNGKNLPSPILNDTINPYLTPIILLFCLLFIGIYLILSIFYEKKYESAKPLTYLAKMPLSMLCFLTNQSLFPLIDNLIKSPQHRKHLSFLQKYKKHAFFINLLFTVKSIIVLNYKYALTSLLLLTASLCLLNYYNIDVKNIYILLFIPLLLIIHIIFYKNYILPKYNTAINVLKHKLCASKLGTGLNDKALLSLYISYYQIAHILRIAPQWRQEISAINPKIPLPF